LAAVENLDVHGDVDSPVKCRVPDVLPDIQVDLGCFPGLGSDSTVEFSLFIPHRVQADLFPSGRLPNTLTEHFRVRVVGTFTGLPIAFVEPDNPTGIPEPSDAVIIVREFLVSQLAMNNSPLTLQILGPSPVHADFYVLDSEIEQERIKSEFKRRALSYLELKALWGS
jgi:hypothetical protein